MISPSRISCSKATIRTRPSRPPSPSSAAPLFPDKQTPILVGPDALPTQRTRSVEVTWPETRICVIMQVMKLSLVAAVSANNVIGLKGMLPWPRIPGDMARLKEKVGTHAIVIGSETARSMMRYRSVLLERCRTIVLTRHPDEFLAARLETAGSLEEAFKLADDGTETELFALGGQRVYAEALAHPDAAHLYLTRVAGDYEGDAVFPAVDPAAWKEIAREDHSGETPGYAFVDYERVTD